MIKAAESAIIIINAIKNKFVFNNARQFQPICPTPGLRAEVKVDYRESVEKIPERKSSNPEE
jgi:hypothetical protein